MWKRSIVLLLFVYLHFIGTHCGITTSKQYVANLLMIGSWANETTNTYTNLVNFGAKLLNNQTDILPDVEINIIVQNCGSGSGNPAKCLALGINSITGGAFSVTGLLTGPYSNDQRILQYMAAAFNLPQVSGIASGNLLSNKHDYPTFLRTIPTDAQTNYVMIDLMKRNGWTHAAVPLEDGDYGTGNRDVLQKLAYENNITLMFVLVPTGGADFTVQAQTIKNSGFRVIIQILNIRETWLFLDAANRTGLLESGYSWILPPPASISPANAISNQKNFPTLNLPGLRKKLTGALTVFPHGGSGPFYDQIFAQWNLPEIVAQFPAVRPIPVHTWSMLDALWSYAIAIDALMKNGTQFSAIKETVLLNRLKTLNFTGVTGQVSFDANGDRIGFMDVNNYNSTDSRLVLAYDPFTKVYTEVSQIIYSDGQTTPPSDIQKCACVNGECVKELGCACDVCVKETVIRPYNKNLAGGLGAIVGIGVLIVAFAAIMLATHWASFSKHGSFYCSLIVCGVALAYVSVLTLIPEPSDALCIAFPWFLGLAFALVYGCLFVKTWALYKVWRSATEMKKTNLRPMDVLKIICAFMFLEAIFLSIWTALDPPHLKLTEMVDSTYTYTCSSDKPTFWSVFLGYKGLWLIVGAILSVLTRNVASDYSESRSIAYATYNNIMLCIIAVPLVIVLESIPGGALIIEVAVIVLAFTFTMCILFFGIWYRIFFPNEIDISLGSNTESRASRSPGQSGFSSGSPGQSRRERQSAKSGAEVTTDV